MKRIICIGNRYVEEDSAGYQVFLELSRAHLPKDVELFEAGLAGLDLLQYIDGAEQVLLVDSISGYGEEGEVKLLNMRDLLEAAEDHYDHSSGMLYLLRTLPFVCSESVPTVHMIGIERKPRPESITEASLLALKAITKNNSGEECLEA